MLRLRNILLPATSDVIFWDLNTYETKTYILITSYMAP